MNPESDHFWAKAASIAAVIVAVLALYGVWQQSRDRSASAGALRQLVTDQGKVIDSLQQEIRDIQQRLSREKNTLADFRRGGHGTVNGLATRLDRAMNKSAPPAPANAPAAPKPK